MRLGVEVRVEEDLAFDFVVDGQVGAGAEVARAELREPRLRR
jgi:hypothetical protein